MGCRLVRLTWDDIFLVEFATEDLLGNELEALHCVLDNLVVPLLVQTQLFHEKVLEDPVEERTATDSTGAHGRLLNLKDRFQSRDCV